MIFNFLLNFLGLTAVCGEYSPNNNDTFYNPGLSLDVDGSTMDPTNWKGPLDSETSSP